MDVSKRQGRQWEESEWKWRLIGLRLGCFDLTKCVTPGGSLLSGIGRYTMLHSVYEILLATEMTIWAVIKSPFGLYGLNFISRENLHYLNQYFMSLMSCHLLLVMANLNLPRYPPGTPSPHRNDRPQQGQQNHWFPLVRTQKFNRYFWGGGIRGLTRSPGWPAIDPMKIGWRLWAVDDGHWKSGIKHWRGSSLDHWFLGFFENQGRGKSQNTCFLWKDCEFAWGWKN